MEKKNLVIILGIGISLVGVLFLLFQDADIDEFDLDSYKKEVTKNKIISNNIEINYNTSEPVKKIVKNVYKKVKKIPKKTVVKYQTFDGTKRYQFKLIDPLKTELKEPKKQIYFTGKIDKKSFIIRVPIELQNHSLSLEITDTKTSQTKKIDLPFISDIQKGRFVPEITIEDFDSIENHDVHFPTSDEMPFPGASIYDQ